MCFLPNSFYCKQTIFEYECLSVCAFYFGNCMDAQYQMVSTDVWIQKIDDADDADDDGRRAHL